MHISAPRLADVTDHDSPPDDASLSTSANESAQLRPRPRRSLASFASYLSTHRVSSSSRPEWPSIDWSNLHDKDDVYRPDLNSMCNTVQQHVLNEPSSDLPAQYNSFVLHILEAYHILKNEKIDLETKLHAVEQCHQADIEEFRVITQSLLATDEIGLSAIAPLGFSDLVGDRLARFSSKAQKPSGRMEFLLSKFDTGYPRKLRRHEYSQQTHDFDRVNNGQLDQVSIVFGLR